MGVCGSGYKPILAYQEEEYKRTPWFQRWCSLPFHGALDDDCNKFHSKPTGTMMEVQLMTVYIEWFWRIFELCEVSGVSDSTDRCLASAFLGSEAALASMTSVIILAIRAFPKSMEFLACKIFQGPDGLPVFPKLAASTLYSHPGFNGLLGIPQTYWPTRPPWPQPSSLTPTPRLPCIQGHPGARSLPGLNGFPGILDLAGPYGLPSIHRILVLQSRRQLHIAMGLYFYEL